MRGINRSCETLNYELPACTNVISEIFRSQPDAKVINWFKTVDDTELYISVLTLGEIRKGCEKITPSNKKKEIVFWLEHELNKWFEKGYWL